MIDYDKIASEYARHRRVHPEVVQSLLATGGMEPASQVLEVGCGTGNYIATLQELAGCSCWGIDPSEQMLSQVADPASQVRFQHGTAEQLDFPTAVFDVVFSVDVIHHVGNHQAYFQEAYRVLKAGGKVCTVTDSEYIIRHRQPLAIYFPDTVDVDLGRYPRVVTLRDLMARVGFGALTEPTVEWVYQLTDMHMYRDKAFSSLHLIPEAAFRQGLARLERDLQAGPIPCVSRYVLLWGTKSQSRQGKP